MKTAFDLYEELSVRFKIASENAQREAMILSQAEDKQGALTKLGEAKGIQLAWKITNEVIVTLREESIKNP